MSKQFRAWEVDQTWLLPPTIQDLVPADHLAHFVRETVREGLDLSRILAVYDEDRGQPPYHPAMMVARCCCMPTAVASTPRAASRRRAVSGWTLRR